MDVGLPGGSGLKLLELLKKQQKDTGVLIVSAKDSLQDRVTGLEMGADDYITKPFYMEELNARINALLRRKNFSGHKIIAIDELYVDTVAAEVKWQDTVISLTKKEYELLLYLIINKNRVVSKQSIARHLWGDDYDTVDNYHTVYVHTRNLRNKITALSGYDFVKTVYGMGYKFTER